jgi:hypothetical protein
MKTEHLIAALAADHPRPAAPVWQSMGLALSVGMLASFALFMTLLGPRPDLGMALQTWRFDLKIAIAATAVAVGAIEVLRLARPVPSPSGWWQWLVPLMLAGGVAIELAASAPNTWSSRLIGSNALDCLMFISVLAAAPLVALLVAMRSGAPVSPTRAGAAVGGLAASLAALFYALHCFDDSPLFVATWYTLALIPAVAVAAAAGRYVLRW